MPRVFECFFIPNISIQVSKINIKKNVSLNVNNANKNCTTWTYRIIDDDVDGSRRRHAARVSGRKSQRPRCIRRWTDGVCAGRCHRA